MGIIVKPLVTEKMTKISDKFDNRYGFVVAKDANKDEIKKAVEEIFNVKVDDVKIINVLPRAKRVGRYEGKVSGYKKAIVKVNAADKINVVNE